MFLRERRVDHLGSYIQPFYVFVVSAIPLDRESYTKRNHVVFQLQKFQSSKNGWNSSMNKQMRTLYKILRDSQHMQRNGI